MSNIRIKNIIGATFIFLLCALCLISCSGAKKKNTNNANLNLDIGIGFSHFDNESDFPAPSGAAHLDVYSSKIVIREAYDDDIIETPLIYNNSSTAYPRMKLEISGNRMYVIYCPDISLPGLQIVSTDDGGESWIQSTLDFSSENISIIDEFCVSFWSTRNGTLMLFDATSGITYVYFTEDSGKTWERQESEPPLQDWHDSLYTGVFLSSQIGFATYNFHSYAPNLPQIYMTLDGSKSWQKLEIKVPASVMISYALAGEPFYDGSKINIPIELYDEEDIKTDTKYYVSYDFGATWEFFADEEDLSLIRNAESEKWFAENRPEILANNEYFISDFSHLGSFDIEENVRIDAYRFVAAYNISDWSDISLTGDMYFDENADLYYKDKDGFPVLLFLYEGDVFEHTYTLLGTFGENEYTADKDGSFAKKLFEEYDTQRNIKNFYFEAAEIYSLFTGYGNAVSSGETMEHGGEKYEKVVIEEIISKAMLKDHISTMFSPEIVEELINKEVIPNVAPLYIDGVDGLYRFGGYAAQFGYDAVVPTITVSGITDSEATLTLTVSTEFYGEHIEFSEDCKIYRDIDGRWKFKNFVLAAEKAWKILQGEETGNNIDKTEISIDNINDWGKLKYKDVGGEQIRLFIEALLSGNTEVLKEISVASDTKAFDEYISISISSYTINKVYTGGQSKIRFDYVIDNPPAVTTKKTEAGSHSVYIVASNNCVYMAENVKEKSDAEKFLSDYFSSTMKTTLPNMDSLRYNENSDITDFLIKRTGNTEASEDDIKNLAYIIFGANNFSPSTAMLEGNGMYTGLNRGNREIPFDVVSEAIGGRITLTVQFYADRSGLVSGGIVTYEFERNGADFKFISSEVLDSSPYGVYKITH
ncbi:MAG: hypothetical protein U0M06_05555 [Clostridia bacterium]|nr:hypothetical protein [Clostridia bacterium]